MSSINLDNEGSLIARLKRISWPLVMLIIIMASIGFAALYSAAEGNWSPWAIKQLVRFCVGLVVMIIIAMLNIRWWYRLAWPCYIVGLGMLLFVEIMGHIGMGAQRWINLGFMHIQPSEIMKIAVIMVLARYYHLKGSENVQHWQSLIIPVLIMIAPVALVMLQPDLGTALKIIMGGTAVIFIAGAPIWWFLLAGGLAVAAIPVAWHLMHDYQKARVMTFLNPESDPLGSGYHITQSKIAIGSGGLSGKGFLEGSQSRLNFLPEKQTDFIFTLWVEEWGLIGGLVILALCGMIFMYGIWIAGQSRHNFGRYLALGLTINFSLYIFINIAMVMGLIPVVGVPLPLLSYGGTAMLASLISFGLIMSAYVYKDIKMRGGGF
jgi:rod shape determining protein RodA